MDQVRITGRLDVPEGKLESAKQEVARALRVVAERYGGQLREVVDRNEVWGPPPEEITGEMPFGGPPGGGFGGFGN